MRMHRLMGTSPTVDRSAVGHSLTPLNLDVLARQYETKVDIPQRAVSEIWQDYEDQDTMLNDGSPLHSPHRGSPGFDLTPTKAIPSRSSSPASVTPMAPLIKPKSELKSAPIIPAKRKLNFHEQIKQNGELERANRLTIATIQTTAKTDRQRLKEDKRQKTMVDVERSRITDAREQRSHILAEAERSRQHEIMMMDKRLQLARIQSLSTIAPAGLAPLPAPYTFFTDELRAPMVGDGYRTDGYNMTRDLYGHGAQSSASSSTGTQLSNLTESTDTQY